MEAVAQEDGCEELYAAGLGLPAPCRRELSTAFPRCILFHAAAYAGKEMTDLCDVLGRVVLFIYLPAMAEHPWLRVSAVFHTRMVKVIGVHPGATEAIYDGALEAEFAGVLEARADARAYLRAARSVQQGELWFPRSYLSQRTRQAASSASAAGLSGREEEVLSLIANGATNQDAADALCVSRETVRWHLRSIYTKLGVSDRKAMSRMARNRAHS